MSAQPADDGIDAVRRELDETRAQQAATSEILNVISRSTTDLQPVLDTIVETASRLCRAEWAVIFKVDEGKYRVVAVNNADAEFVDLLDGHPFKADRGTLTGRVIQEQRAVQITDAAADPEYTFSEAQRIGRFRTMLGVPLMREGEMIGNIALMRTVVQPFTEKQIELVSTFADQAVIAIENARLFDEVQARTEDLAESLRHQTATADVLKVISRSAFDLQAVLDTLLESAAPLCDADIASIRHREGDTYRLAATYGCTPEWRDHFASYSTSADRGSVFGRTIVEGRTVHIPDVLADAEFGRPQAQKLMGFRAAIGVPMLREKDVIGVLNMFRFEPSSFSKQQIELMETFADQAAIAIENVRLFEAEQARTQELTEALERQTATSEVLNVISRSTTELQPVLDTIASTAARLCRAEYAAIFKVENGQHRFVATNNSEAAFAEYLRNHPGKADRSTGVGRTLVTRGTVHIPDVLADPEYDWPAAQQVGNYRTVLGVPLLRDEEPIGVITLMRTGVEPFTDGQIQLVTTFADQAVIAIENVRLFDEVQARTREITEALERQTATSEVLGAISRSATELQPVLDTIVKTASRLCSAEWAAIFKLADGVFHLAAAHGVQAEYVDHFRQNPIAPGRGSVVGRVALEKRTIHMPDALADPEFIFFKAQKLGHQRTVMGVPLLREGDVIGVILLARFEVAPFADDQIQLVTTFADQAVIAIENVRLFDEVQARTRDLTESLKYQTATSEVLNVISRSAFDLEAVFQTLLGSAARLCGADVAAIRRREGADYPLAAWYGSTPEARDSSARHSATPDRASIFGRAVLEGRTVHVPDVLADPEYERSQTQRLTGVRAALGVPMLRDGEVIGVLTLFRTEAGSFSKQQIELVETFAHQAVIAIENVRLFDEVQARTHDLAEALKQRTATGEVLNVISRSPSKLQPVLDTIVDVSSSLCRADLSLIFMYEDGLCRLAAANKIDAENVQFLARNPIVPSRSTLVGRIVLDGTIAKVDDIDADPDYDWEDARDVLGVRSAVAVPLKRDGETVGMISLTRQVVEPFTDKEIELAAAFADQAVIAIQNVRLFEQVQERTRELTEALDQQTTTAEILNVISNSLDDTQPVFDAIVESGLKLFSGAAICIALPDGDQVRAAAVAEQDPARAEAWRRRFPFPLSREYMHSVAILDRRTVDIPDVESAPPELAAGARNFLATGYRAITIVPMMRGDDAVGALSVVRSEPGPLSDKQRSVLGTFSRQAVIAIENTRLLGELRETLQQQTATADVLKVISQSAFDLPAVLHTLVEAAARLCEADQGTIAREQGGRFYHVASYGFSAAFDAAVSSLPVDQERGSATGRALVERRAVHIPDVHADPEYTFAEAKELGGFRAILAVPMLREGEAIGVLALTRIEARPFTDKQIELVSTFADQAAIAIENVRLFESAEARSRELAASLEELRSAQDRLVQTEKLASLGQLTAGIAHEIKNPLNFINNFSAVSRELADELQELVDGFDAGSDARGEIDELAATIKDNMAKIVEHGQRADSIVKNMLLHARQGSSEHRMVDVNALVEESLNLAYHGARAEGRGFNVTLERSFDPAAGDADLFPQEITRVLLNLISNGFYAVTKRKGEVDGTAYEPVLRVATRDLGDRVEITIRDNGTGIPQPVKERLFTPFFTTKPVGEGTGLGLSISHDIVVKQHGGSIEVDSEPREFTEFRIVLPRAGARVAEGAPK